MNEKYTAIIIEDNAEVSELLKSSLVETRMFKKILIAENGAIGLRMLGNEVFDLVITDVEMPLTDGIKVLELVMTDKKYHFPKCIVVSGTLDPMKIQKIMGLGVRHILAKPFSQERLIEKVKELL